MTSSEGLAGMEPWNASDSFSISESSWDGDLIARAIQRSIFDIQFQNQTLGFEAASPPQLLEPSPMATVSSASGGGGSELENHTGKRKRSAISVAGCGGKARKRRSRAAKRSQTTFINADPANFRQMVQQVTGARYGVSAEGYLTQIVKPEPQRAVNLVPFGQLDTPTFLSNHRQESLMASHSISVSGNPPISSMQPSLPTSGAGEETYQMFPTLESWRVV